MRHVVAHPVVASTNDLALQLAADRELPTPLLVAAEEQTAGRGRGANRWWSARGGLMFSLVLDAQALAVPADAWPRLSLAAALAVCDVVQHLAPAHECGIRWPNDVYLAGKKVCGILPEWAGAERDQRRRLVLGLGLNLNNSMADAPEDIRRRATSLTDVTGVTYDLTATLACLLQHLEATLERLSQGDPALGDAWASRCLLRGRDVQLLVGKQTVAGRCSGIAPDGSLLVDAAGGCRKLFSGVVVSVDPA